MSVRYSEELRDLARHLVKDSIVTKVTERFVLQIIEVCAEYEREKAAARTTENAWLRAEVERLTKERDEAEARNP